MQVLSYWGRGEIVDTHRSGLHHNQKDKIRLGFMPKIESIYPKVVPFGGDNYQSVRVFYFTLRREKSFKTRF